MPNFFSPGVYTVEKDISTYPVAGNSSIVGIVGFASKGPVNEATLITSPENLVNTFGEPSEDIDGQGLEGALEILEATNSMYFVRAATDAAAEASTEVLIGTCPTFQVSSGDDAGTYGYTKSLYLKVQVANKNGTPQFLEPKLISLPAGTVDGDSGAYLAQTLAMQQVIGGSLDADKIGYFSINKAIGHSVYGSFAGSSAYIAVSSYSDAGCTTPVSAVRPLFISGTTPYTTITGLDTSVLANATGWASSVIVYGGTIPSPSIDADGAAYYVNSLYPGAGYNLGTAADGTVFGNSVELDALGNINTAFSVNDGGAQAESFKVSLYDTNFIESEINTGLTNRTSDIIKGYFVSGTAYADMAAVAISSETDGTHPISNYVKDVGLNATTPIVYGGAYYTTSAGTLFLRGRGETTITAARAGKLIEGTYGLDGGDNGTGTASENIAAIIGSNAVTPKTGIYALDYDDLNISIALVPGKNDQQIQNALITLAEETQNFVALVSPPYGAINTPQEAIDWTNGKSETRTAAINSSYAAVHWPWVKVYSVFDEIDRWYDPSIFAARQMCYTDSIADPWFAPAGFRRGRLTKPTEVEVNLNQGDRDSLYSGGNIVNPIVSFPQAGIAIFGQRTAQRTATALDRINVRRLMIYLRKAVLNSTQSFVFEPNDPFTWEAIRDVLNPLLEDIRSRRGIINYSVICDETTNTPVRVDRNELWCKVVIQPTKAAEVIVFELNVTNQSAKIGG
jgi:phage tail sheath protein FI